MSTSLLRAGSLKMRNHLRGIVSLLFMVLLTQTLWAQSTVKGVVKDEKGSPIIGASVILKGTTQGVSTGADGSFTIQAKENAVLQISYIGYQTQEVNIGTRTQIDVKMEPDVRVIDDVVVVGYGSQRKANLTGSVASITFDQQMANRSVSNVSSSLSGLIPGLAVNQNTAMAGKNGASLIVRGLGTVNNASPLIVVDGMPDVDINRLNMNDIESITVLKDASSSAVYGSRAANGVVLITTKSGSSGKTQINFSASHAISEPIKMIDLMPDYPRSISALMMASGAGGTASRYRWGAVEQWAAMSHIDPLRYPNTDWMDLTSRTGGLSNYNISASGGNDRSRFFISGGIMDERGIHMSNDFTRYNTRFSYSYKIRDNIKVGAKFDGSWHKWNYARDDGWFVNSASGGLISAIAGVTPYDPETERYGGAMMYGEDATIYNPYREYCTNFVKRNRQDLLASVDLEWQPLKGLTAAVDYNLSYGNQLVKNWANPHSEYNFQTDAPIRVLVPETSPITDQNETTYRTLLNGRLTYERSFGRHDFKALFVYSEEYAFSRNLRGSSQSRIHPGLTEIDATLREVMTVNGGSSSWGLRSYIGRLNYGFDNRYLFEASFRYDGSSKFYPGYQYGFFPSGSFGWRFMEEDFMRFADKVLSSGKLRVSYGGLGNNSGVGNTEQKETLSLLNYTANKGVNKGFVNKKMINQTLSWETTNVFNLGLDLGFLRQRLTVEFDYYNRYTKGMLRPDALSTLLSGAYNAPKKNIGEMRNQGFEWNITWSDQIQDFQYSVNFNGAYNVNQLKRWNSYLGRGNVFIDMPHQYVYMPVNYGGIVQDWQTIYNAPWQAGGSAPGDLLLQDLNGDGRVDGNDQKAFPKFQRYRPTANFGLNFNASWKGLDLSMVWVGTAGRKDLWINHFNKVQMMAAAQSMTYTQYYDTWNYDNRGAMLPRLVTGTRGKHQEASTYWLDDMSYVRLKNLQIGYSLPQRWLKTVGISSVRFYVSGENLLTFTKYRGLDPEKALTGTGSENDAYPMIRTISFGINIGI